MAETPESASTLETDVLVVGGGPVGLALVSDLGWRGVDCVLVERSDGVIITPKMNEVNARTMEFCRRWGIDDQVMDCPFPQDYPMDVAFVTTLAGYELGRMRRPAKSSQKPSPNSPHNLQICSQLWFDPILKAFAEEFNSVRLLHRHQMDSFEETADGIAATVLRLADQTEVTVRAKFIIGCDGASSSIRNTMNIGLEGAEVLGRPVHFYFRAPDLLADLGREPATFLMALDEQGLWCNIRIIDPTNGLWRLMVLDSPADLDHDDLEPDAYLRRAVGRDYNVEWVGKSVWIRRAVVAKSYGAAPVFLAGDAVHQLSPTGALGMNTGIGDAVDLGWKLAARLAGWGGDRLLASYDAERRPIGWRNVNQAAEFHTDQEAFGSFVGIEDDTPEAEDLRVRVGTRLVRDIGSMFRTEGLQLGYTYENSPICIPDGTPPPPDGIENYDQNGRPGARAPHVWLEDSSSTLDLFGEGFVLLVTGETGADLGKLVGPAAAAGVPLKVTTINDPEIEALYGANLILVRPDGHVAWRGDLVPDDGVAVIDRVRGTA